MNMSLRFCNVETNDHAMKSAVSKNERKRLARSLVYGGVSQSDSRMVNPSIFTTRCCADIRFAKRTCKGRYLFCPKRSTKELLPHLEAPITQICDQTSAFIRGFFFRFNWNLRRLRFAGRTL